MHEVGLLNQALEMALEAAAAEGAARITKIKLRIGALAGVVPEAMAFAFDVVTKGTIAEGGEFAWEEVPVICRCGQGCPDFQPEDSAIFACPQCGQPSWQVLQGRELNLIEVEVEEG